MPPSVGKIIGQTRQAKSMTQKDLAVRINEKPSVIQEYESGKAIPHAQILSKMERVLGVKLRGKDIGNPVRVHAWRLTLAVGRPQKVKEHVVHPYGICSFVCFACGDDT